MQHHKGERRSLAHSRLCITLTSNKEVPQKTLGTSPHCIYAWDNSHLMMLGPDSLEKPLQHCWNHIKTPTHPTVLPLCSLYRYPVNGCIRRAVLFPVPTFQPHNKTSPRATGLVSFPCRSEGRALLHSYVLFPPYKTHLISLTESWHTTSLPTSKCSSNPWSKVWQSED